MQKNSRTFPAHNTGIYASVAGRYNWADEHHGINIFQSTGVLPIPPLHKYLSVVCHIGVKP